MGKFSVRDSLYLYLQCKEHLGKLFFPLTALISHIYQFMIDYY